MKLTNKNIEKLKENFPIFKANKDLIYFDNAATTQKPKEVLEAILQYYATSNANASRGVYSLAEKSTNLFESARKTVANFVNADEEEIIFTKNASESINLVSHSLFSMIPEGKNEIVLTEMEHHSNLVPWQEMAKKNNMKLKFIKIKNDFTLDMQDAKEKINGKTAIVSFCQVSNVLGTVNPVKEIIEIAKKHKAFTVIDAAQSVPHMNVNVKDLDCDFLAFSGHKMLGPFGIGALYGRKNIIEKMSPFMTGGGMISKVTLNSTEFANIPRKFESGTQNISGAVGLAEAIKYLDGIGMDNISKYEKELTKHALEGMKQIQGISVYVNENNCSGILSFNLKGIHPHDLASLLDDYKICIRAGHHCAMPLMDKIGVKGTVRVSFYFYNTLEEVNKFVKTLKEINKKFNKNGRSQ